jgi:hypothetical protein
MEENQEWDLSLMKSRPNPYAKQPIAQEINWAEKLELLPPPLLREVEDFVDFLLARYAPQQLIRLEYQKLAALLEDRGVTAVVEHIHAMTNRETEQP